MKHKMYNNGFTLIEILAVVLIIGILASIAVAEYRKVIMRSRISEALVILKRAQNAFQLAYLEDPSEPPLPQDILDLTGGEWHSDGTNITNYRTQNFDYHLPGRSVAANGFLDDDPEQVSFSLELRTPYDTPSGAQWENFRACVAYTEKGHDICRFLEDDGFEVVYKP